jgi:hypothetical protein
VVIGESKSDKSYFHRIRDSHGIMRNVGSDNTDIVCGDQSGVKRVDLCRDTDAV